VLGNGAFLATRLGSELVPRLWEGTVVLNTVRLAGISLDESVRYGTRIEQALLRRFPDEIERIWTRTGSPEVATDPMGIEVSDVFVQLRPRERWRKARSQDELVRRMSAELESMPGMRAAFTQPIEMRMNEMIAGIRSDLGVKLFGEDFETLRSKARVIERVLRGIRG
ncbi:MAG: efflux RND transporter permease subunit, partial [Phycisphaerae bacterium]|nr:efflux RND transporter permease subunit [Phycisphaerae bacterium]